MITNKPIVLKDLSALFRPSTGNIIEQVDVIASSSEVAVILRIKRGKYDKKIATLSACVANGFDEYAIIHST